MLPTWQPQTGTAASLWGRPLHVWLVIAAAVALLAVLMPWYSEQSSYRVSWTETGYDYGKAGRSTWYVPTTSYSRFGGGNGVNLLSLALVGTVGGLPLRYRNSAWPRWAAYSVLGAAGLTVFVGLVNVASDPNIGPLLFALAGGAAVLPALQTLRKT